MANHNFFNSPPPRLAPAVSVTELHALVLMPVDKLHEQTRKMHAVRNVENTQRAEEVFSTLHHKLKVISNIAPQNTIKNEATTEGSSYSKP